LVEQVENYWFELGQMMEDRGDAAGEREAFAQLAADRDVTNIASGYLRVLDGKPGEAVPAMKQLAAKLVRDGHLWTKMLASDALYGAALAEIALGQAQAAADDLRCAIDLLDRAERIEEQRRLARLQTALARLLVRTQPEQARRFAQAALAWSRAAGGYDARVA